MIINMLEPTQKYEEPKHKLTNEEKETIIAKALETDEGRQALAMAMVEPIRKSLEYQAVGRKLLYYKFSGK